eukprot:2893124-Amphidinium_carterae.1
MALEVQNRQEDYQTYQKQPETYQVKWGKYSGQPLSVVLQDAAYVKWILSNKHRCGTVEAKILLHHVESHFVLSGKEVRKHEALEAAMSEWTQAASAETAMEERMLARIQERLADLMKQERFGQTSAGPAST